MTSMTLPFKGRYVPPVDDPYGLGAVTSSAEFCVHGSLTAACHSATCRPPGSGGTGGSLSGTVTTGQPTGADWATQSNAALTTRLVSGMLSTLERFAPQDTLLGPFTEDDFFSERLRSSAKVKVQKEITDTMMGDKEYTDWLSKRMDMDTAKWRSGELKDGCPTFFERSFSISVRGVTGTLRETITLCRERHLEMLEAQFSGAPIPNDLPAMWQSMNEIRGADRRGDVLIGQQIEMIKTMSPEEYYTFQQTRSWVTQWANTSSDHSPPAIAAQLSAAKRHGINTSSMESFVEEGILSRAKRILSSSATGPFIKAFTKAEYENTQRQLADAGVTEVVVFRGFQLDDGAGDSLPGGLGKPGDNVRIAPNPLSSWAFNFSIAKEFAERGSKDNVVFAMKVPVSAIQSVSSTGRGCLSELEVVVLAGDQTATIITQMRRGFRV